MNLFSRLSFLLILILASSCQNISRKTLRVGVMADYPPFIFQENNDFRGLEADYARELSKELNQDIEFKVTPWTAMIPSLINGDIDIIMSALSLTTERSFVVKYLPSYTVIKQMLLVRKEEQIQFQRSHDTINPDFIIGVKAGTTSESLANNHFPNNELLSFSEIPDLISALKNHKIDCFLHEMPALAEELKMHQDLAPAAINLPEDKLAWAVNLQDIKLHQRILDVYSKWKMNGTLDRIRSKWIPEEEEIFKATKSK